MKRRTFFEAIGIGTLGFTALNVKARARKKDSLVTPRNSAENLILINLQGGPSHVDTFDLKVGSWTPADFQAGTYGGLYMAGGLFPQLSTQTDKFSFLRSISHNEAVHSRASYLFETAHTFNPTFAKEQPHLGSLISYELESQRRDSDVLPTFVSMNGQVQGPGMLASTHAAFGFDASSGVQGLEHPHGQDIFQKRYASLLKIDRARNGGEEAGFSKIADYHGYYELGEKMMYDPDVEEAFTVTEEDLAKFGNSGVGSGCATAVKLLSKDRGTRVIQINQGGWDTHYGIYTGANANTTIYELCGQLDTALAALLADLAALPGKRGGSLLDETMVLVAGEFGRTPGPLSRNAGRDHYPYAYSALVAGGGIISNQQFGATDSEGWSITDRFWSQDRAISIHDVVATVYSSLGIDWTKEIEDTPSGRVYEYTPKVDNEAGYYKDIVEMFA